MCTIKLKFNRMFDEFDGMICEHKENNFLIINKGMIREVMFYNLGAQSNVEIHRIKDFNFKITKLFKPSNGMNYKIEFDFIYLKTNEVERISAYVKLYWWNAFIIKFTKGDYWITSREVSISVITCFTTIIIEKILDIL